MLTSTSLAENPASILKSGSVKETIEELCRLCKSGERIKEHLFHELVEECVRKEELVAARSVHSLLTFQGPHAISLLDDFLIRLFGSAGSLIESEVIFCAVAKPTVYTWQALISVHSASAEINHVLHLYLRMKENGVVPNKFVFLCILKACSRTSSKDQGSLLHQEIAVMGLDSDISIGCSLIDMHAKIGGLGDARAVFDAPHEKNEVMWGAMIAGYVSHGHYAIAFQLFIDMQKNNVQPSKVILLCILKACVGTNATREGKLMHSQVIATGLDTDMDIGNILIDFYARCGNLKDAQGVFEKLPLKNMVSWGALIGGYCVNDEYFHVLALFSDMMQHDNVECDDVLLVCVLKACSGMGLIDLGKLIHDIIIRSGFLSITSVGNSLIDMYAKCECIEDAHKVFDNLRNRDVVTWGAIVCGYVQNDHSAIAIELFCSFLHSGMRPNIFLIPCILKACSDTGDFWHAKLLHKHIMMESFDCDLVVGNALVDMYAKFGSMDDACRVHNSLQDPNIMSWSSIIAGHVQLQQYICALQLFGRMQEEAIEPNLVTFLGALKACAGGCLLLYGRCIHANILECGLEMDLAIVNTLVDMYCKCSDLMTAQQVFQNIQNPDEVTWNVMIAGYCQDGQNYAALELFERMENEGIKANGFTYPTILKACGNQAKLEYGKIVHDQIIRNGLASDLVIGSALADMYVEFGLLMEAYKVFDYFKFDNEVLWGIMISGYARHGEGRLALMLLKEMLEAKLKPETATLIYSLIACGNEGALRQGYLIHELTIRNCADSQVGVATALIDMYGKCGALREAQMIFDCVRNPDVALWGAMLAVYAHNGDGSCALDLYEKMKQDGVEANEIICLSTLKACSSEGATDKGKLLHDQMICMGFESDAFVGNMLVNMYSNLGNVEEVQGVLEKLSYSDILTLSAVMLGHAHCDGALPAFGPFDRMQQLGILPCEARFLSLLRACGNSGSLKQGRLIHHHIIWHELEPQIALGNSLIYMYAECGSLEEARNLFDRVTPKAEVSWSVMVGGYTEQSHYRLAKELLSDMQKSGLRPHGIVFSKLFSGCNHEALLEQVCNHFKSMKQLHCLTPSIEHYNCIIDLLGRAGCLKQAEQFLQTMPASPDIIGWVSLLASSRTYNDAEMGKHCFDEIVQLDSNLGAAYVLMSKIYNSINIWEGVDSINAQKTRMGVWKKPGKASIEVEDSMYDFFVGEHINAQQNIMQTFVRKLRDCNGGDYIPCVDVVIEPPTYSEYVPKVADSCNQIVYPGNVPLVADNCNQIVYSGYASLECAIQQFPLCLGLNCSPIEVYLGCMMMRKDTVDSLHVNSSNWSTYAKCRGLHTSKSFKWPTPYFHDAAALGQVISQQGAQPAQLFSMGPFKIPSAEEAASFLVHFGQLFLHLYHCLCVLPLHCNFLSSETLDCLFAAFVSHSSTIIFSHS